MFPIPEGWTSQTPRLEPRQQWQAPHGSLPRALLEVELFLPYGMCFSQEMLSKARRTKKTGGGAFRTFQSDQTIRKIYSYESVKVSRNIIGRSAGKLQEHYRPHTTRAIKGNGWTQNAASPPQCLHNQTGPMQAISTTWRAEAIPPSLWPRWQPMPTPPSPPKTAESLLGAQQVAEIQF